jgi:preprotein translocase subunit SecG
MFTFLLFVQFFVAFAMVVVILIQKSEGGGLTGGSPSGLMSARGAADFLTRATAILATAFIVLSILLAVMAASRHSTRIDSSLQRTAAPTPAAATPPAGTAPATTGNTAVPFALPGAQANTAAPANSTSPFGQ